MPTVEAPAELTVDLLMEAIKQLSPAEWLELQRQLGEWQARNSLGHETEAQLLTRVRENSGLPDHEQHRFDHLRQTLQEAQLTTAEEAELQAAWQRVEQMNVARLDALTRLARQRGKTLSALMQELGIPLEPGVF